jgi:hypothetical protein
MNSLYENSGESKGKEKVPLPRFKSLITCWRSIVEFKLYTENAGTSLPQNQAIPRT